MRHRIMHMTTNAPFWHSWKPRAGLSLRLGASNSCQLFLSLLLEALDIVCTSTLHDKHSLVMLHNSLGAG